MSPLRPEGPKPQLQAEPLPAESGRSSSTPAVGREGVRPASFYTPPPNVRADEPASPPQSGAGPRRPAARWALLGLAAAAVVTVSAWYGLSASSGPPASPPVIAAPRSEKTFVVAAADLDQKATDQLKALLAGAAPDEDELKAENAAALRQLDQIAPQMAKEVERDERRLYRVYLLDFLDQDGDQIELMVDGISFGDLNLSNAGTSLLVPVAAGKPTLVRLVAKVDGGGGITVGFISSAGEARTHVMQPGQVEQWQVVVQ